MEGSQHWLPRKSAWQRACAARALAKRQAERAVQYESRAASKHVVAQCASSIEARLAMYVSSTQASPAK